MTTDLDLNRLVSVYLKMRAKRSALKALFDEEDEKIAAQQDKIKETLAAHCKENNVESGRTDSGGFYRKITTKYWTNDWGAMGAFIVEHNVPDLLERRLNQTNTKEFLRDHPELLPPGLNVDSKYELVITKPKKGE